jgi:hypothetical protein
MHALWTAKHQSTFRGERKKLKNDFWNCGPHRLTASSSLTKKNTATMHLLLICSKYSHVSLSVLSVSRARHSAADDV